MLILPDEVGFPSGAFTDTDRGWWVVWVVHGQAGERSLGVR